MSCSSGIAGSRSKRAGEDWAEFGLDDKRYPVHHAAEGAWAKCSDGRNIAARPDCISPQALRAKSPEDVDALYGKLVKFCAIFSIRRRNIPTTGAAAIAPFLRRR